MNILKKIVLSTAILAAFATVSAPAFAAEEHVDKNAVVKAAAAETRAKIQEAIVFAEKGIADVGHAGAFTDKKEFIAKIGEARQAQKEYRYEQTERLRQKLNDKLRGARESADIGMGEALHETKAALAIVDEMDVIYNAAHK
jgi:large subunit ribosomal protein L7/L12